MFNLLFLHLRAFNTKKNCVLMINFPTTHRLKYTKNTSWRYRTSSMVPIASGHIALQCRAQPNNSALILRILINGFHPKIWLPFIYLWAMWLEPRSALNVKTNETCFFWWGEKEAGESILSSIPPPTNESRRIFI